MGFVYLKKTASTDEMIEGKKAFEPFARQHNVRLSNYHADNGIFKAHQWMQACRDDQQGMTFAGVNAHHQNGHAERRIRELQELARVMLIHANARWKDSITPNLWSYALRIASDAINNTPCLLGQKYPATLSIGNHSAPPFMFWKMSYKEGGRSTSGNTGRSQAYTWENRLSMGEMCHWC